MNTVNFIISMESYTYEIVKMFTTFLKTNSLVKDFNVTEVTRKNKITNGTHKEYIFNFSATDEIVNSILTLSDCYMNYVNIGAGIS